MAEPRIQYAKTSDGVNIAYAIVGQGPAVVFASGAWGNLHLARSGRAMTLGSWIDYLVASDRSVVLYDLRGTGSSDHDITDFSLEARVLDLEAVVDRLGLDIFPLVGLVQGCLTAIAYAAARPERVSDLILLNPFASGEGYYAAIPAMRAVKAMRDMAEDEWELFTLSLATWLHGVADSDFTKSLATSFRSSMTPRDFIRFRDTSERLNVGNILAQVSVPTLVIKDDSMLGETNLVREVAAGIPGAHFVTTNDVGAAIGEVLGLAQSRTQAGRPLATSPLRTVLFTDLVGHTEMMSRLGDARGRDVLREHERITREVLKANGGTEVKTMGDGFMASFGSVTKAVECAIALQRAFAEREGEPLNVRVGLNAGEPIEEDGDLFGATVILASRIAAKAEGGEILVADTVRGLCSGKGFLFADRGEFVAKGFEEPVRVYEVRWQE